MKFIKRIILFIILMGMTPLSDMGFVYAESSEEQQKKKKKKKKKKKSSDKKKSSKKKKKWNCINLLSIISNLNKAIIANDLRIMDATCAPNWWRWIKLFFSSPEKLDR